LKLEGPKTYLTLKKPPSKKLTGPKIPQTSCGSGPAHTLSDNLYVLDDPDWPSGPNNLDVPNKPTFTIFTSLILLIILSNFLFQKANLLRILTNEKNCSLRAPTKIDTLKYVKGRDY